MAIRVYKPMTAGTRQRSVLTSEEIIKVKLLLDTEVAE